MQHLGSLLEMWTSARSWKQYLNILHDWPKEKKLFSMRTAVLINNMKEVKIKELRVLIKQSKPLLNKLWTETIYINLEF